MRTTFTLLIAFVCSLAARAADEGRLTLTFSGITNLYVQVDNRNFSLEDNVVCIDRIPAGRHTVRVLQPRNGSNVNGRQLYTAQVQVRAGYHVDISFNRFGKAFLDERRISGFSNEDAWGNSDCGTQGGWGNNNGGGNVGGWGNGNGNSGWGNGNNGNGGGNGNGGANAAMTATNFAALLSQLHAESFDNTKLALAKNALSMNRVTAAQVKQLMQQFSFDTDRLDLAKSAYPRTVDKNNYFQVMDAFEFSNSKEQLSAWVRTQ